MHIEYRITEKSYRAAAMLAMRKRSTMSTVDYYGPYIFCIVWLAAALVPALLDPNAELDLLLTLGVLPIILGFLALRRKRMRYEYSKLKSFHLLQALDLDAAGLRLITTAGTSRSAWQVYTKFVEDKTSFILYVQGSETFVPIPKGELTLAQIDELRALLAARLPHD
jgi:hypothetical protein